MFEQNFEPLCGESANLGRIALVPWDIETFGFGVADYRCDTVDVSVQNCALIAEHLEIWAGAHKVELIGTTVPACDTARLYFLQSLGFRYINTTLTVCYERIENMEWLTEKVVLTPSEKSDLAPVMEICGQAFKNGRYHDDIRVPKQLADLRYQHWASRTFEPGNQQVILVAKKNDQVCAFSIVEIDGEQGRLHLNAVAPKWQGKRIGIGMLASTICYFQQHAVNTMRARISAVNLPVVNMHAALGARFYDAEILLSWHAPWATHLVAGK